MNNETKTELHLLAASITVGLFAKRDTMQEAFEYASQIADASDNPAAVMTALHVVLNTLAARINELADKK
jgi:hypothetical protein